MATAPNDDELERQLKRTGGQERGLLCAQLALLHELDARGLPQAAGYPSLYDYCLKELGWSESQAYERCQAARALRRFGARVGARLAAGTLSAAALAAAAPFLCAETADDILDLASGKTRRQVEDLLAELDPRPDSPDTVERLPPGRSRGPERDRVRALSAERVQFGFTGSAGLRRKVERSRELLWHKDPAGRLEAVFESLADFYLDREDPDRRLGREAGADGAGRGPDTENGAPTRTEAEAGGQEDGDGAAVGGRRADRRVPPSVKDEVWLRDGGRCSFVAPDGRRCEARAGLEYDHIVPWVLGGRSDSAVNIRLLCRAHNRLAAERAGIRWGPPESRRRFASGGSDA